MASECAHSGRLRLLITGSSQQFLWHLGTGEVQRLEAGGALALDFDDSGMGFVGSESGGAQWANDILDLSLHVRDAADPAQLNEVDFLIHSRADKSTINLEERQRDMRVLSFKHSCVAGTFVSELYVHPHHRTSCGMRYYWCLPFAQDAIFGSDCHNRWLCRRFDGFEKLLRLGCHLQSPGPGPSHCSVRNVAQDTILFS